MINETLHAATRQQIYPYEHATVTQSFTIEISASMKLQNSIQKQMQFNYEQHASKAFFDIVDSKNIPHPFTYKGFLLGAARSASKLIEAGVKPGDRVLICMSHQTALFLAIASAFHAGAIPIVMTPPNPKISEQDYAEMIAVLIDQISPRLSIVDEASRLFIDTRKSPVLGASTILQTSTAEPIPYRPRLDNMPVIIQYSSGTTGLKKGVEISEAALLEQIERYTNAIGITQDSVISSWLPLYHDMGLICSYWTPLLTAARAVHMSPFDWLSNPQWFLRRIEQMQATHIWLPNFAYSYMARWYKPSIHGAFDLSSIQMITNCSEPVTDAAQNAFLDAFSKCGINSQQLHSCYAMAETTFAMTSTNHAHPQNRLKINPQSLSYGKPVKDGRKTIVSSGVPIAGTTLQIRSSEEKKLPDRHVGSIHVQSPSLMSGYFNTASAATNITKEDFFATGDIGFISDDHLYVVGRMDDMIIAYGANYDPVAIEEALWDIKGIIPGRAAAIGVTLNNPATTDIVILCETNASTTEENQAIASEVRSRILKTFNFIPAVIETLPRQTLKKASSGKISRKSAHAIFASLSSQNDALPSERTQDLSEKIHRFLKRRFNLNDSAIDSGNFLSSGLLDSLAIVDLILLLEENVGKPVPSPLEVGFDKFESIQSICHLAEKARTGEYERPLVISDGAAHAIEKTRILQKAPSSFSSFILSSSNFKVLSATELSSDEITFFNFYTGGASLPDFYAITSYILETIQKNIETLIISIDIERVGSFLELPSSSVLRTPVLKPYLLKYSENIDLSLADRRDAQVRNRRINQIRFGAIEDDVKEILKPNGDSEFLRNGKNISRYTHAKNDIQSGISAYFMRTHNSRKIKTSTIKRKFLSFSHLIKDKCDKIIFIIPPYHPKLFDAVINDPISKSEYNRITNIISESFPENTDIIDMREPSKFGGDPEDFMDVTHPGPLNGICAARLLKAYLATAQKNATKVD